MKFTNIFIIMLAAASILAAQSFRVDFPTNDARLKPGESVLFEGYVHNTSSMSTVYTVTRVTNLIPETWTTSICVGITCYPPWIEEASSDSLVAPGDSMFFDITFNTDSLAASGEALLRVSDALSGEMDSILTVVSTKSPIHLMTQDSVTETLAGQSHAFSGYVFNEGDKPLTVFMVREQNNLPPGWSTQLCFGACPLPSVDTVNALIMNGDSLEYSITFYSDETPASGNALLAFYAVGEADTLRQTFRLSTTSTAIGEEGSAAPQEFQLLANYPNPFNPKTVISYQLPVSSQVELSIFNILGQKVAMLVSGKQKAGKFELQWDASGFTSGIYFYNLSSDKGFSKTRKLVLLK